MKRQTENRERSKAAVAQYMKLLPDVGQAAMGLAEEVYKDGALSGRTKRLMALTVGLAHGCRGCILAQTDYALECGATAEEVLEACAVTISMGGTMGFAETTRVVAYLEEKGLLPRQ